MANNKKNANYVTDKNDVVLAQKAKAKRKQKIKEVTKQVLLGVLAVVVATLLITGIIHTFRACTKVEPREFYNPNTHQFEVTDVIELEIDGYGKVLVELYGKDAPKTVENFKKMVGDGYYDSKFMSVDKTNEIIIFSHSLEKNEEDGHDHGDEGIIKGEFYDNDVENKISHVKGVLTMYRSYYSSSETDFMIMTSDKNKYLGDNGKENENTFDGVYAAFGKIVSDDIDVIEKIANDYNGVTDTNNEIKSVKVGDNSTNKPTEDNIKAGYIDRIFTPEYTGKYTFTSKDMTESGT